jgi:hypothetical protein
VTILVPCCFDGCSFAISFPIKKCDWSSFVLLDCGFAIQCPLTFHMNCKWVSFGFGTGGLILARQVF